MTQRVFNPQRRFEPRDEDGFDSKVTMTMQRTTRNNIQIIYGIALVLMGVGVFYRIPQIMPELARIGQFANALWVIRGCFYFMGIILIGGGIRKIYLNFRATPSGQSHNGS